MAAKWKELCFMEKYLLTVADVQQALGLGRDKTYRLFRQKNFPSIQIDGRFFITKKEFEHWLDRIQKIPDKKYTIDTIIKNWGIDIWL